MEKDKFKELVWNCSLSTFSAALTILICTYVLVVKNVHKHRDWTQQGDFTAEQKRCLRELLVRTRRKPTDQEIDHFLLHCVAIRDQHFTRRDIRRWVFRTTRALHMLAMEVGMENINARSGRVGPTTSSSSSSSSFSSSSSSSFSSSFSSSSSFPLSSVSRGEEAAREKEGFLLRSGDEIAALRDREMAALREELSCSACRSEEVTTLSREVVETGEEPTPALGCSSDDNTVVSGDDDNTAVSGGR